MRTCLDDISQYKNLKFPYTHSKEALKKIETFLGEHLNNLDSLSNRSDAAAASAACSAALQALSINLPLLGFILRSMDVRNAFEIYGPLLRMCQGVLGDGAKLILSSEWEYSPFTYVGLPVLPEFVLIGFPAPEAANPLLVPLAGHELGHQVWYQKDLEANVAPLIQRKILEDIKGVRWEEYKALFRGVTKARLTTDLFQPWSIAYDWARSQAQEAFCDCLGLRIFRESFLHAFSYLLAPNLGGYRPEIYPNMMRRVSNLVKAANTFRAAVPPGYEQLFADLPSPPGSAPQSALLLNLADGASQSVLPKLIKHADNIISRAAFNEGRSAAVLEIYESLRVHIVPAKRPSALSDILNAGWKAFRDRKLWRKQKVDRDRTLKELLLKSIEVLEFRARTNTIT